MDSFLQVQTFVATSFVFFTITLRKVFRGEHGRVLLLCASGRLAYCSRKTNTSSYSKSALASSLTMKNERNFSLLSVVAGCPKCFVLRRKREARAAHRRSY